jgi:hypothetical protein
MFEKQCCGSAWIRMIMVSWIRIKKNPLRQYFKNGLYTVSASDMENSWFFGITQLRELLFELKIDQEENQTLTAGALQSHAWLTI